jgi:outer membrane immunogenic protein
MNGIEGGGQIGCNYQTGNWVVGIEIDGSVSAARAFGTASAAAIAGGANPLRDFSTKDGWLATARGRVGHAMADWLWYVTGGVAYAGFEVNNTACAVAANACRIADKINRFGWIVGLGSEYALGGGWSAKGEVLYANFGTFHYTDSPAANGCVQCYSADVKVDEWILRIGLNRRFGGGA